HRRDVDGDGRDAQERDEQQSDHDADGAALLAQAGAQGQPPHRMAALPVRSKPAPPSRPATTFWWYLTVTVTVGLVPVAVAQDAGVIVICASRRPSPSAALLTASRAWAGVWLRAIERAPSRAA